MMPIHEQCATFPTDRGVDLGKNQVGLGKLSNLEASFWNSVKKVVGPHALNLKSVYNFKYFQALPFGLFEFEDL